MKIISKQGSAQMTANEYIDKLRNDFIKAQIISSELDSLIEKNNVEQRDVRGYHGREILELLQNADDAYQKLKNEGNAPDCELEIDISYINNILTISNTGTSFDEDGVKAIVQGNNSPKKKGFIGNKGTGFRSILNWAQSVEIDSGAFHIIFSEELANKVFNDIRNEPQIVKQLKKEPNLYIPMLAVPQNKDNASISNKTTIRIAIDPQKSNDEYSVDKQLNEIDLRILLFLPNVSSIKISTDEKVIEYERAKDEESHEVLLEKKIDGNIVVSESFWLFEKIIEDYIKSGDGSKDLGMAIAIPEMIKDVNESHLYSFFPVLKTSSPFKCILHATYELDDQRNNIIENPLNYEIIKEQIRFLFSEEVAGFWVKKNDYTTLYEILAPVNPNEWCLFQQPFLGFKKYGIDDFYFEQFKKAKIFRTVNDATTSLDDNPKILEGAYPKVFKGPGFENLLVEIESQNILKLIKLYSNKFKVNFNVLESDLLESINKHSNNWDVSEQIGAFIWWNGKKYASLPNLLKNSENEWLKYKQDCYFLVGDVGEDIIPKWSKIPALNKRYQDELLSQAELLPLVAAKINGVDKQPTHRVISQSEIFPCLVFHYIDRSTVISLVNSSVDSYEKAVLFVKWLWKNYNIENWLPPDSVSYHFPVRNKNGKQVDSPQSICFGKSYGNRLAQLLFDDSYGQFPGVSEFDVSEDLIDEFVAFIRKFGVAFFPIVKKSSLYTLIGGLDNYYQEQARKKEGLKVDDSVWCKYEMPFIDRLDTILRNVETVDVIEWIAKDCNLFAYISNSFYNESEAKVEYKYGQKKNFRELKCNVRNYILEMFNEIPWIQIGGKRFSPKQVLKGGNSRINPKFSKWLPIIDSEYVQNISEKIDKKIDIVRDIFNRFSLCENPTELPSSQFYDLMLKIPTLNISEAEDLSRTIYRIVEQPDFNREYANSFNFQEYKKNGKILVKYKGVLQFYDAKEAILPSSKIVNANDLPIVVKSPRSNNENFKRLFGCKEYDKTYEINKVELSSLDGLFQSYFKEFKKYAQAYSIRNNKIAEVGRKLTIQLANKIEILINAEMSSITEDYSPIRKTVSCWYITCFGENIDYKKISVAIESIYENIANTNQFDAGKIGELFRESDKSSREFLIKKEFGSLDVIEDGGYEIEVKNNFIAAVQELDNDYDLNKIEVDFEHIESESSIEGIICVLKELNADVDKFQKAGFAYPINLIPYYKILSRKLIQDESRKYKNYLFTTIRNDVSQEYSVEELKNKFIDKIRKFESFVVKEIPNSVSFDVREKIKEEFGDWECLEVLLNADDEYSANYAKLNPQNKFGDDISSSTIVQTMIYFNKIDDFNEWMDSKERELSQSEQKKNDVYAKLRCVTPEEAEIGYRGGTLFTESKNGKKGQGAVTKKGKEKKDRNQKIAGNKGELLVYNLLCKKYGKDNVFPRSEAYVDLDILKPGQAVSGDYDISYKDSAGNEFYVEVKTGDSQSFFVSPDEMKFARENVERYELIYVYNLDNDVPNYHKLPKKFWEDPHYQKKEIVEKIEFRF